MTKKSIWDDEPEMPVQYADDMKPPVGDLIWLTVAIAVVFGAGGLVGRWIV